MCCLSERKTSASPSKDWGESQIVQLNMNHVSSIRSQVMAPRPHLLIVQPVSAYSPPVVAEVILNCWICHLHGETRVDLRKILIFPDSKGQSPRAIITPRATRFTFSSSKLSVKCRISANCLARACSLSRCCMGAYGGLVSASSRLRKAFSANTSAGQKYRCTGLAGDVCCAGFYLLVFWWL